MGDSFRTIVDSFASLEEAPVLADRVISYLIERRIVRPERSDCVLGKKGSYPPGENVGEALATWTPHHIRGTQHIPGDPLPLETIIHTLRRWSVNGVEEVVGRTVFHNFGAGLDVVRCPVCLANQVKADWGDAVGTWYQGDNLAAFRCPSCNESSPIIEWTFDPPWAFGNLGFNFWNWPPMKRGFIDRLSGILGHKVVVIAGKI
jgi:hypothetical protein